MSNDFLPDVYANTFAMARTLHGNSEMHGSLRGPGAGEGGQAQRCLQVHRGDAAAASRQPGTILVRRALLV